MSVLLDIFCWRRSKTKVGNCSKVVSTSDVHFILGFAECHTNVTDLSLIYRLTPASEMLNVKCNICVILQIVSSDKDTPLCVGTVIHLPSLSGKIFYIQKYIFMVI